MPTLEFKGKHHIYAHHLNVPYRPLLTDAKNSCDPCGTDDNLIIHGDNLHALKALLPRYAGRIKCIYIDPPYNTGKEGWIYNDNVNSALMRDWLQENSPVDNEDLERHDKWLCMMWPRLHLLRELLSDEGIIFVSIDDNEQQHLRMMMDEIFGEQNFFAVLTRRAMHTVRNSSKDFNHNADYVLAYAREKAWFSEDKSRYIRHITDKSDRYPFDDDDGRGKYKLDPLHARNYYRPYDHTFSNGVEWSAPNGRYPAYSQDRLAEMEREGRIVFGSGEPKMKRYLVEVQEGQPPNAILSPEIVGFNADGTRELADIFGERGKFPQPKPTKLIKFLLDIIRCRDAVVLDSFAGSGTTAHAVLALNNEDGGNRRFILIEREDYAEDITAERVKRVIRGVPTARDATVRSGLAGSFSFATLGEPIELDGMLSGEGLPPYGALAAYLLYNTSGISAGSDTLQCQNDDGRFHSTEEINYHLLYRADLSYLRSNGAVLTEERAKRISAVAHEENRKAIVFAAAKYIGQRELTVWGITFCQLPYELSSLVR